MKVKEPAYSASRRLAGSLPKGEKHRVDAASLICLGHHLTEAAALLEDLRARDRIAIAGNYTAEEIPYSSRSTHISEFSIGDDKA